MGVARRRPTTVGAATLASLAGVLGYSTDIHSLCEVDLGAESCDGD